MNTGKMRHDIKIVSKKDTSILHSCKAKINELHGEEKYIAMSTKTENSIKFEIRYLDKLKVLKRYRIFKIIFDSEEYEIIHVDFNNFRNDKIVIQAKYIE